jgi:bisphosphoglycerate-dependent phosphoglycerate mutase
MTKTRIAAAWGRAIARKIAFTGWTGVDLSHKAREEAREANVVLRAEGYTFDQA